MNYFKPVIFALLLLAVNCSAASLQQTEEFSTNKLVDSLFAIATGYIAFDNEIALLYAEQGKQLLNNKEYKKGLHDYYFILARVAYYNDNYVNSQKWLDSVSIYLDHQINSLELAKYYSLNSSVNTCIGDFQKSIEFTLKSIQVRKSINDLDGLAMNTNVLGKLYLAQGNEKNAEKYYRKALALYTKDMNRIGYGNILLNMGILKNRQDSIEEAKRYFFEAHELFVENGGLRGIASSAKLLARIAKREKRFSNAIDKLTQAEQIYLKLEEKYGQTAVLIELSSCYLDAGIFDSALEVGKRALALANKIESDPLIANAHLAISKAHSQKGDYKDALEEFELYSQINTKMVTWESNKKINDLELQAEMLEKEKNIEILNQKTDIQSLRILILILIAGLLLIGSIWVVFYLRARNKSLKQQHLILEERNRVVEVENKLNEQKKLLLENDLELKNKELASKALALLQLNETLQDIGEKITEVKANKDEFDSRFKNQIIQEIHQATHNNIWEEFDIAFKQVHNSFYDKLLELCPNLSSTEIKIAALLRLNLSTKEIAAISFKSESAVKITRHRIRSKLGLESGHNLISFLLKL